MHPPPRQSNDTDGESSWYSDYLGLVMPFSSSVTLDKNRSLLPPYQKRPRIYCYYDSTATKDKSNKYAESSLLLTWRRAWWAQGFRPIILSEAEAMNNPYYERLSLINNRKKISPDMYNEVMRWLAFDNMKGGILAHHLVFPMAPYDHPLLTFLRRANYPRLTRWEEFGSALFVGSKEDVHKATMELIDKCDLSAKEEVIPALPDDTFAVQPAPKGVAFYRQDVVGLYGAVAEESGATKIQKLNDMINGHLHLSFQNSFRKGGINVLKPKPLHTSEMIAPALQLAQWLALCPETPVPGTCPPNNSGCTPCKPESSMMIFTGSKYLNDSNTYTIATVPHPLTLGLLDNMRDHLELKFIRREMARDQWLTEAIDPTGVHQLISFKEAVAKDSSIGRSLWLQAEKGEPDSNSTTSLAMALKEQVDIDWHFGFRIPRTETDPAALKLEQNTNLNGPVPKLEERAKEGDIMAKARKVGRSKDPIDKRVQDAMEAWHMQDTEAWRFARAFRAREQMELRKFEKEEEKFAGGAGSEKRGGGWLT